MIPQLVGMLFLLHLGMGGLYRATSLNGLDESEQTF